MLLVLRNSYGWGSTMYAPAIAISKSDLQPLHERRIDVIQRGPGQKWCGSGDVFISHTTYRQHYSPGKGSASRLYNEPECRTDKGACPPYLGGFGPVLPSPKAYMMAGGCTGNLLWIAAMSITKQGKRYKVYSQQQAILIGSSGTGKESNSISHNEWMDWDPGYDYIVKRAITDLYDWFDIHASNPWSPIGNLTISRFVPDGTITHVPPVGAATVFAMDRWRFFHLTGSTGDGSWNAHFQEAYIAATENLPFFDGNNIANLVEAASLVKDLIGLLKGDPSLAADIAKLGSKATMKDVAKYAGDAWLKYRYQYSTTKMDIEEMADIIARTANVYSKEVKTGASVEYDGGVFSATMSVSGADVFPPSLSKGLPSKYWQGRMGLNLDAYNIWDMIPFSFIVDWGLHIGDKLQLARDRELSIMMDIHDVWYSYRKSWVEGQVEYSVYLRFHSTGALVGMPLVTEKPVASDLTVAQRAADTLSLVASSPRK